MITEKVPCVSTLKSILKSHFSLRYKKTDKSKLKYKDPTYNEKRLWVSKLLAQFHFDNALIVSVDESNFRSQVLNGKQWELKINRSNKVKTKPKNLQDNFQLLKFHEAPAKQ